MNIYQLVYVSTATLPLELDDIQAIEKISKINNSQSELTGLLTYCDCKFMQFLEGHKRDIDHIFSKIQKDTRHHSIDVLRCEIIPQRQFSGWHMRYTNIEEIHETHGAIYTKIFGIQSDSIEVLDRAKETITLLNAFKNSCPDQIYTSQVSQR